MGSYKKSWSAQKHQRESPQRQVLLRRPRSMTKSRCIARRCAPRPRPSWSQPFRTNLSSCVNYCRVKSGSQIIASKHAEEARSGQNGQEENIEELDGGDIEEDEEAAEGPSSAKQIKLGENSSTLSIELKEKSQPSKQPKIEVNQINLELSNILKPELIALGIHCQILRDWIHLHTPKHEDGNNFGVEVQGETIQELAAVT